MIGTPLRQQYLDIKRRHPDAILLFRIGDFYETFEDDAKIAASLLDITLTSREMGKGARAEGFNRAAKELDKKSTEPDADEGSSTADDTDRGDLPKESADDEGADQSPGG